MDGSTSNFLVWDCAPQLEATFKQNLDVPIRPRHKIPACPPYNKEKNIDVEDGIGRMADSAAGDGVRW